MEDISFFLPTRKGSQRVKGKNTKPFAGLEGGLLYNKLTQLLDSQLLKEIVLSTNDEQCLAIAKRFNDARLKVIERPEELCLDTTALTDLIKYVPEIVQNNHIMWGHVTTPFVKGADYDKIIRSYFQNIKKGHDGLVTVKKLQNFLIDPANGKIINSENNGSNKWPRTQDLDLIYEVNHVAFVSSKQNYLKEQDRIGKSNYFFVQDELKSFDIDWESDFLIAEAIQKEMNNAR